ncbi:unnamed protein product, partial [Staurois parvus]
NCCNGPRLYAAVSAPHPFGPSPLLSLGERLFFQMDRLWEQRRLSNAPSNLEGLLELQQNTLIELVTAVWAQTVVLQENNAVLQENNVVLHDIRALCQAGLDQNAPSNSGSQTCVVVCSQ